MTQNDFSNPLGSPERFGYSWDAFNKPTPEQEIQFQGWTAILGSKDFWLDKTFLDAGCGAGRNSLWPMTYGAKGGLGIDLDERSLEAARRNLNSYPSLEIRFQSIYELPEKDAFDVAFSLGVIHHLDNPELAVRQMVRSTKPGGKVLIWVYGRENLGLYVYLLNPLRTIVFSHMPLKMLHKLAWFPTVLLWLLVHSGLTRIEYLKLLKSFTLSHLHVIVFDQMLPKIAHYWRQDQVVALLEQAGLKEIQIESVNQISWSAVGSKPL